MFVFYITHFISTHFSQGLVLSERYGLCNAFSAIIRLILNDTFDAIMFVDIPTVTFFTDPFSTFMAINTGRTYFLVATTVVADKESDSD